MGVLPLSELGTEANELFQGQDDEIGYFLYHVRYYISDKRALIKAKSEFIRHICDLDELLKLDLQSIFIEAFKNAIEHGNRYDSRKSICVKIYRSVSEIVVHMEDEGEGWDRKSSDYLFDNSKIGLRLIHSLSDEVSFTSNGRKIIFKKYLPAQAASEIENPFEAKEEGSGINE